MTRLKPAFRFLAQLAQVLLLALLVAAGALALRLAAGPVRLDALAPYIAGAVERSGPFRISFAEPALAWSQEQQTVQFRVRDLEVRTDAGAFVASAPSVGLRVDLPSLLRQRRVRVREAEVALPALRLVRQADGGLVLNFDGRLGALPLAEATGGGVLDRLTGGAPGARDERLARLRRIRVVAAGLQYVDEASGRSVESGRARLRLTREPASGWELRLDVAAVGGAPDGRLRLTARPVDGSPELQRVAVEVERVPVAALDQLFPALPLEGAAVPVSADLRLTVDTRTRTPGPGTFELATEAGEVADPRLFAAPVRVRGATLSGEAGPGWREVRLAAAELRLEDGPVVRAAGSVETGDATARLRLELAAEGLHARALEALWPLPVAPGTRRWYAENVDAGTVPRARVDLTLPRPDVPPAPGARPEYVLGFEIVDGASRFLPDWPAAEGLSGAGRLDRQRFALDLATGRIGEVAASRAALAISGLDTPALPARLTLDLDAAGPVPAAFDLLARQPLDLDRLLGFAPSATAGAAEATVSLGLPLQKEIRAQDVTKKVSAKLRDLRVDQVREGFDVTAGDLDVALDDAAVDIAGPVALNTVPAQLKWRERLSPGRGEDRRRVDVTATLNRERAAALGASAWPDGAAGTVPLTAVVTEADRQPRRITVQGDLRPLALDFPALGIVKRAGEPGRLEASLRQPEETRLTVADATATFGDVSLRGGGDMRLNPFDWRRLDLAAVRTPLGELSAAVTKEGSTIRAEVDAARLDLRPYRAARRPPAAGRTEPPGPDLDLSLRAASLLLGPEPLQSVALAATRRGGRTATAEVQALVPGGGTASFSLKAATLPGEFAGETSDLGAFLRGVGLGAARIEGGRGRVAGRVEVLGGRRVWDGEAKLRDLVVRDAPTLARILTLASLQGLGNALSGREGLELTRVTAPFTYGEDDGRVELRQTRAVGSGLGGRVDGTVDTAARTLALGGTVAPLYGLTRLIGQIPILGNLLRGGKADAAFAATFTVGGTLDAPEVAVNPLAAVVPGAIRDLFGDLTEGLPPPEPREREARD